MYARKTPPVFAPVSIPSTLVVITVFCQLCILDAVAGSSNAFNTDFTSFVSRPELKAPVLDVSIYRPDAASPGYWLFANYHLLGDIGDKPDYQSCQIVPHIYDDNGDLVWSDACMPSFRNRNGYDFRAIGSSSLSVIFGQSPDSRYCPKGAGLVLNASLEVEREIQPPRSAEYFDGHEFNIVDNGTSALIITYEPQVVEMSSSKGTDKRIQRVGNDRFLDINLANGNVNFDWWSLDHISLDETTAGIMLGADRSSRDYFHMNSVEKLDDGDYLVSARHTDTIYKMSGSDGRVVWRLGGTNSSFILEGFNFSAQHDARFHGGNDSVSVITYLDNASNGNRATLRWSSGLLIAIHTSAQPMVAILIQRWDRPDRQIMDRRGNVQLLPNGNALVAWSEQGYMTEFTADGELVLEAKYLSAAMATYRACKVVNLTTTPREPPTLRTIAHQGTDEVLNIHHVSWNGATEVAGWRFFGLQNLSGGFQILGERERSGFETTFTSSGILKSAYAEAITSNGTSLRSSPIQIVAEPGTGELSHDDLEGDYYSPEDDTPTQSMHHDKTTGPTGSVAIVAPNRVASYEHQADVGRGIDIIQITLFLPFGIFLGWLAGRVGLVSHSRHQNHRVSEDLDLGLLTFQQLTERWSLDLRWS